jgi:hypothetical protein
LDRQAISRKAFKNEISIPAFRSPSIGLEYRHSQLSVHAGEYLTAFKRLRIFSKAVCPDRHWESTFAQYILNQNIYQTKRSKLNKIENEKAHWNSRV